MKTSCMILVLLALSSLCMAPVSAKENGTSAQAILTFRELRANPEAYRTSELTFRGQFHKLSNVFSPFFTFYTPSAYVNFSAWEYDAPLWVKEVYKSDFPFLYVAKSDRRICALVSELPPYTRFEAKGRIQSTFDNIPWIQVTSFRVLPDRLNKNTIRYMAKGYALRDKNKYLDAAVAFSRAWKETLPLEVKALIRKEEGKCLYAGGSYEEASEVLDEALDLVTSPEEKKEVAFVLKEAEAMIEYLEDMKDRAEESATPPGTVEVTDEPQAGKGGEDAGTKNPEKNRIPPPQEPQKEGKKDGPEGTGTKGPGSGDG